MAYTKETLASLKRVDLQRICKDYGLRANLKTEALIELILDSSTPMRKPQPPPPEPTRRSVSTRMSSRTSLPRTSSVIIHPSDDEEAAENVMTGVVMQENPIPSEQQAILPRTRKAKDTQRRLGVGRPVVAGGGGARAVTKSISVSKSRRGKSGRSVIPVEETIPEEDADKDDTELHQDSTQLDVPNAASGSEEGGAMVNRAEEIERQVNEALKPIVQQLESLKLEIEQYKSVRNTISQLETQVTALSECKEQVRSLTAEVEELREKVSIMDSLKSEVKGLRETVSWLSQDPRSQNDTELAAGFRTPPNAGASSSRAAATTNEGHEPLVLPHPGFAPKLLGKRHRDSTASIGTDMVEEGQEEGYSAGELARKVVRSPRKRARTASTANGPAVITADDDDPEEVHRPGFVVYNDCEAADSTYDPPPPTTPLPRLYSGAYSPSDDEAGPSRQASTSSRNAAENHPFTFSFLPVPPTPHAGAFAMQSFPYPEPPISPTPGGNDTPRSAERRGGGDIFQSLGYPSTDRSRSAGTSASRLVSQEARNFVNSATLASGDDDREQGSRLSSGSGDLQTTEEGDSVAKRTMYGTELETDTRFGDFGVEGVAKSGGFWTGGRF